MRSILRATALLSGSSIVSILVGLISAKAWAVLLGPSGLGQMGLLQSLVGLAGLLAGTSISTGLVRMGAGALARGEHARVDALQRGMWWLCFGLGALAAALMALFREPLAAWMLGGPQHAGAVVLMSAAVLLNLISGVRIGILNVHHRVAALAQYGVLNSLLATGASLLLVWLWGEAGVGPAILAGAAIGVAAAWWLQRRELPAAAARADAQQTAAAAAELLRFGLPYTASMLVGTGVQFALPAIVLHTLGPADVGFFRAAVAISVTYLGFLLNAMALDYYPRVSAVSDRPDELGRLVNQQQRLVLLLAGPLILGVMALAPLLVPLIYDPAFAPAVEVLEWQLIGDLLKFSSWTLGFVILARRSSLLVFGVELLAGANTLLASWLGMALFGVAGAGMGFLFTYAAHYAVVSLIVRRDIGLRWSGANLLMLAAALAAALAIKLLPLAGLAALRTPFGVAAAALAGAGGLYLLWRDLGREPAAPPAEAALPAGEVV